MDNKNKSEIIEQLGGIKLKNIDLSNIDIEQQYAKVAEEEFEFAEAITHNCMMDSIEEFYDCMQAKIGLLQKKYDIDADKVMEYYPDHLEKIKYRPR